MKKLVLIFRRYTLLIAMLLGVCTYPWMSNLNFLTPYFIFLMLYFTFCGVSVKNMRLRMWHLWVLLAQMLLSILAYVVLFKVDKMLAEGIMICFLMPTATAAAVITGKLGGSIEEQTTYTLLSSLVVAIVVPALFPLINQTAIGISFHQFLIEFWIIIKRVFPLLIFPFLLAMLTRAAGRQVKLNGKVRKFVGALPFYLWAFSLVILMASTTRSLVEDDYNRWSAIWLALGALVACVLQFYIGKQIGSKYNQRISAGQALGQKNTIFGIWLAYTYLTPVCALGSAAYIVWQNLFNAFQLAKKQKK